MSTIDTRREQMFPKLPPREIDRLRRFGEVRRYAAGEALFVTGEIAPGMSVLIKGSVRVPLGPAQKLTLDLGQGAVNARKVSDNKIQLKFRTKDFEGEYFHYTGDLFLIYKSGHLMKLMCLKRES